MGILIRLMARLLGPVIKEALRSERVCPAGDPWSRPAPAGWETLWQGDHARSFNPDHPLDDLPTSFQGTAPERSHDQRRQAYVEDQLRRLHEARRLSRDAQGEAS